MNLGGIGIKSALGKKPAADTVISRIIDATVYRCWAKPKLREPISRVMILYFFCFSLVLFCQLVVFDIVGPLKGHMFCIGFLNRGNKVIIDSKNSCLFSFKNTLYTCVPFVFIFSKIIINF